MTHLEQIAYLMSEEGSRAAHAERYPGGCRLSGHMCEDCGKRLNDAPHAARQRIAQRGRPGYRQRTESVCAVRGCAWFDR